MSKQINVYDLYYYTIDAYLFREVLFGQDPIVTRYTWSFVVEEVPNATPMKFLWGFEKQENENGDIGYVPVFVSPLDLPESGAGYAARKGQDAATLLYFSGLYINRSMDWATEQELIASGFEPVSEEYLIVVRNLAYSILEQNRKDNRMFDRKPQRLYGPF